MAINNSNPPLVASQPLGTSSLLFGGYSSNSGYSYTTPTPAGTYIVSGISSGAPTAQYSVSGSANNEFAYFNNNSSATIRFTTTETNFTIAQYGAFTPQTPILPNTVDMLSFANGNYFMGRTGSEFAVSTDTITWTTRNVNLDSGQYVSPVVFAASLYVAGGASGGVGAVSTSPDTITWTTRNASTGNNTVAGITFGNNVFVAVGTNAALSTSTNGTTWTTRTSGFGTSAITSVGFGNGLFVAVGAGGTLRTSTDGITWTARTAAHGTNEIRGVTYGKGLWVTVGGTGGIATSTDGITWTSRTSPYGTSGNTDIVYGNGVFLVNSGNDLSISTDAIRWTTAAKPGPGSGSLPSVTYGNGIFVIGLGSAGDFSVSRIPSQLSVYTAIGTGLN